jgi:hypothetical protein
MDENEKEETVARKEELRKNPCNYCSQSESAYCDHCNNFSNFYGPKK